MIDGQELAVAEGETLGVQHHLGGHAAPPHAPGQVDLTSP